MSAGLVFLRPLSWLVDGHRLVSSHSLLSVYVHICVLISSPYRDANHVVLD